MKLALILPQVICFPTVLRLATTGRVRDFRPSIAPKRSWRRARRVQWRREVGRSTALQNPLDCCWPSPLANRRPAALQVHLEGG